MIWCFIVGVIVGFVFGYKVQKDSPKDEPETVTGEEPTAEVVKEAEEIEEAHRVSTTPRRRARKADK